MAIVIQTQPQTFQPVKNPIEFRVESTNITECGFRFVGSLYIQKEPWLGPSAPFTKVIEVRKYPLQSTSNQGVFDFSNILEDFITVEFDYLYGTPKIGSTKTYMRYYVKFEEEYEPLCDGVPVKYNTEYSLTNVVFNGRLDFNSYKKFIDDGEGVFRKQFLSNAPVYTSMNDGMNYPLPTVNTNYTHKIYPGDLFPVIFNWYPTVFFDYKFIKFELTQNNGLYKTKLVPITTEISTLNNYVATDFGPLQRDPLTEGNINTMVIDDQTKDYRVGIFGHDGETVWTSWNNSGTINIPIPDDVPAGNPNVATNVISITNKLLPTEIEVRVNITHTFVGDLNINLVSPSGKIMCLKGNSDGTGNTDNLTNTIFSSNSTNPVITSGTPPFTGTFRWATTVGKGKPSYVSNVSTMKTLLNDYNSYGDWRIVVSDHQGIDTGILVDWSIRFKYKEVYSITDQYQLKMNQCCQKNNVRFYWLNKLGGWDSFSFIRNKSKKMDISRNTFEKYVDYSNYRLSDAGSTQYDTQLTYTESVFSDFIDITTSDWLVELFTSPVVYMCNNNDNLNVPSPWTTIPYPGINDTIPYLQRVVITDNTYSYVTKDNTKLVNYNINYKLANQNDIIRF